MKTSSLLGYCISFYLIVKASIGFCQNTDPVGNWEGRLKLPTAELRVQFKVEAEENGLLKAKMASPDQGATGIPVAKVIWTKDSLTLEVAAIGGEYKAKMSADGTELNGVWKQGLANLPLNVKKVAALGAAPKRPQEPQKPYPYLSQDVKYNNKKANVSLGGTLTLPKSTGPHPAVILISGSGAQNRDSEILGHKPFLVISDYLTRKGIAVLRVDDRGVGSSGGNAATATSADNASDVEASLQYLRSRPEIHKDKIGLVGHSEGGMIAPMVASASGDVSFVVLLAGIGFPGDVVHRKQVEDIMRLARNSEDDIQKGLAMNDRIYSLIKSEQNSVDIEEKVRKIIVESSAAQAGNVTPAVKAFSAPWFRYFINFDPKIYLKKVKCPVLALNGGRDVQVSKDNLDAIKEALKQGGNKDVTVTVLPDLNHLFQTATTGGLEEYAKLDETFSPVSLKIMSDWILTHTK